MSSTDDPDRRHEQAAATLGANACQRAAPHGRTGDRVEDGNVNGRRSITADTALRLVRYST